MTNNESIERKPKKKGFATAQRDLIIGLAVVLGVLLVAYFAIIRPLLADDGDDSNGQINLIWSDEELSTGSSVLLFRSLTRDQIQNVEIHNPKNDSTYVDWGFYYAEKDDTDLGIQAGNFYLTGFEYAAFDETQLSYLVTASGIPVCSSRIEDHCTDFSKYGLDADLSDLSKATHYTVNLRDGSHHTVLVGNKLPSGRGYYVRSLDESENLATHETMLRDSVYAISDVYFSNTILATPMAMVTPYLGLPVDTSTPLDAIALWINEDRYYYVPEGGTEESWNPVFTAVPISSDATDPFSVFAGMSVYSMRVPKGYYSSTQMQNLSEMFGEFKADSVLELGTTMKGEDGEDFIGFSDEIYEKYDLSEPMYQILYRSSGIDNIVLFSKLQEGGYYYAYSMVFNAICKISSSNIAFLEWEPESYIMPSVFFLGIDNCHSFSIEGSYIDTGLEQPYRKGLTNVNSAFRIEGTGKNMTVTERESGQSVDVANFRKLYTVMLQIGIRKELDVETIREAMKKEPMATVTAVTREETIYEKDSKGNNTTTIAGVRPSVSRVFRFYEVTGGRCLITVEDIDEKGVSKGENGAFYSMTASLQKLLSSTVDLLHGTKIDSSVRG